MAISAPEAKGQDKNNFLERLQKPSSTRTAPKKSRGTGPQYEWAAALEVAARQCYGSTMPKWAKGVTYERGDAQGVGRYRRRAPWREWIRERDVGTGV